MKRNYPFKQEFAEYLSLAMTEGSVKSYLSYVAKCFSEFSRLTNIQLEYDDLMWLAGEQDCGFGLEDIRQYLKDSSDGVLESKYFSGFDSYIQFIASTGSGTYSSKTTPSNVQKAMTTVGLKQTIMYSHDDLLKNFELRLKTQNRIVPGSCYFPASLFASIEPGFNRFITEECEKIGFIYEKNHLLMKCLLKDVSALRLIKSKTSSRWELEDILGGKYTLWTEVPTGTGAIRHFNGCDYIPMNATSLKSISIDHDPEIARILSAADRAGLVPRLTQLTGVIGSMVADGLNYTSRSGRMLSLPKTIKSSNAAQTKRQLAAIAQYWKVNGKPAFQKLMYDVEYIHSQMSLTLMDGKFNLNKNKGKNVKGQVKLTLPTKVDYLP